MVPCIGLSQFLNFSSIFHKAKFLAKSAAQSRLTPFLLPGAFRLIPNSPECIPNMKAALRIPEKYQFPCHSGHCYY